MRFSNGTLDLRDEVVVNYAQFLNAIDAARKRNYGRIERIRLSATQEYLLSKELRPLAFFDGDVSTLERSLIKTLMGYELLINDQES